MRYHFFVPLVLLALGSVFLSKPANAAEYSNVRIVRLSLADGNVQFQRPGEDWEHANPNQPLQEGFTLRTTNGHAEVEFEDALIMRMGSNSTVKFTNLRLLDGGRITQITISEGTAIICTDLNRADAVSIAAADDLSVKVPRSARFRVDVTPAERTVTVIHGQLEVQSASQTTSSLSRGRRLHAAADGTISSDRHNPDRDSFDKWVSNREENVNLSQRVTVSSFRSYTQSFTDSYSVGLDAGRNLMPSCMPW